MIATLPNTPSSETVPATEHEVVSAFGDIITEIASVELYPSDKCNEFLLKSLDALSRKGEETK